MTPGLSDLVEYREAAERLHDHPFTVATTLACFTDRPTRTVDLKLFVGHQWHHFVAPTYEKAHDMAVRMLMVFNRLDRIRGGIQRSEPAWW